MKKFIINYLITVSLLLFSRFTVAEAFLTQDLNLNIPWLHYTAPDNGQTMLWGKLHYTPGTNGEIYFEVDSYGLFSGKTNDTVAMTEVSPDLSMKIPTLLYQSSTGNMLLEGTLVYEPSQDGKMRFKVADYKVLSTTSDMGMTGIVAGGFAKPLTGATLEFYDSQGELIAKYENVTGIDGVYNLPIQTSTMQDLASVKAYGGSLDGVPYKGEIVALCTLESLSACNITPYSSVVTRLTELYSDTRSSDRVKRATDLINTVTHIDRDPSLEIMDLSQLLDLTQWELIQGDGSNMVTWYDQVAADIADGYLDDDRFHKILIASNRRPNFTVSVFGEGEVRSDDGKIVVQSSTYQEWREGKSVINLTATPADGYRILYWNGCDIVSKDQTKCSLQFEDKRLVSITFGQTEVEVVNNIVDLTAASHQTSGADNEVYTLTADIADQETQQKLSSITVGHYIVSSSNGGFLRQVTAVEKMSNTQYVFTTTAAFLSDVIKKGTIAFRETLNPEDIEELDVLSDILAVNSNQTRMANRNALRQLQQLPPGSETLIPTATPRIYLKRAVDPQAITIVFGEPLKSSSLRKARSLDITNNEKIEVVIYDKDKDIATTGDQIRASGEWTFKFGVEVNLDFGIIDGVRSFKFITIQESTEKLTLTGDFSGLLNSAGNPSPQPGEWDCAGTICAFKLKMKDIIYFIGPVPIVLTPEVVLKLGFEVKTGFKTEIILLNSRTGKNGFIYIQDKGVTWVEDVSKKE